VEHQGRTQSRYSLDTHGITNANTVWWNLSTPSLYEHALQRHEGLLAHLGPLPEENGTRSEVFVLLHFGRQEVLIGGTAYAGEIKKSVLTIMTYLLPSQGVLPMHCSANYVMPREWCKRERGPPVPRVQ
jgi:ATP-dependent phosphoenolpyruvate carboxykinase